MRIKNLAFSFLLLMFTFSMLAQDFETHLRNAKLSGPIRQLTEYTYVAALEGDTIVATTRKTPMGVTDFRNTYNQEGYRTEEIQWGSNDEQIVHFRYEYHKGVEPVLYQEVTDDGDIFTECHFKTRKRTLTGTCEAGGGQPDLQYEVEYNKRGQLLVLQTWRGRNDNLSLSWKTENHYDEAGHLTDTYEYPEGILNRHLLMQNDSLGNPTRLIWSDQKGATVATYSRAYNEQGFISDAKWFKDGRLKKHWEYTYEYDEAGNWIKRIMYINGSLSYLTLRTIEYY